jgi:hypothetical protein
MNSRNLATRGAGVTFVSAVLALSLGAAAWGQSSNPTPFLDQPVAPDAVAPGSASFTLTVNGTGFVSGSVVQWNGGSLPSQFVSPSQLTASVPASDIAVAGTALVTVSSPGPSGNVSNAELFSVTSARPGIALAAAMGALAGNTSLAVADFNGDGRPDVAVPNETDPGTVSVLLGNGDGTFQPAVKYSTGSLPYVVVAADLNHDGKMDLVVTNGGDNTVSVLLGNGDGTFQPHVDYMVSVGSAYQNSLVIADFNRDGNTDLAVCCNLNGTVSVLLGNGDGTFQSQLPTQVYGVGSLAVGDFNGDDILDLADGSAIWLGNGDGTFTQGSSVVGVVSPIDVVTADFNGDGKLDLALINGGDTLYVALGKGDGTFQNPVTYTIAEFPTSVAVADFNGDGKLDLAVGTDGYVFGQTGPYGVISTLLGNGDGTFQAAVDVPGSPYGLIPAVAAADFNGDGMMDLATVDGGLATVFLGTTAAFSPYIVNFGNQNAGTTSSPQSVTLTNDGDNAITISNVSIVNGDFAQTNNCGTSLAAGASCTFNVTFTPTTFGGVAGQLIVTDSALGSPQTVALVGTGEAPGVRLLPGSLAFGDQLLGTTSHTQVVNLTNVGNQPLSITKIQSSVGFPKSGGCPGTLAANASCNIRINFAPTRVGVTAGTLIITDNAAGSPQTVPLSGTGIAFKLSSTYLNFGSVPVGQTSSPQTITVMNVAQAAESISIAVQGASRGEFPESNNCGTSLAAGATCTITVSFAPTSGGGAGATLDVNGGGADQAVSLGGTGTR